MKSKENIWTFYENMSEIVTVIDIDTATVVYMNQKAKAIYGINSDEQMNTNECYDSLKRSRLKYDVCGNDFLKPNEWHQTEGLNLLLQRKYRIQTTLIEQNGHRYRLEIAIDITPEEIPGTRNKFSTAYMNSLTNEALHIARYEQDSDKSIQRLLEYLGKALRSDRSYIFEYRGNFVYNTYEWCAYGVTPEIDFLQNIPVEDGDIWHREFEQRSYVLIQDVEETKESSPQIYEYLKPQNITSLVVVPLYRDGKVAGFYGLDNPPLEILEEILPSLLKTIGHFIDSLLERRELMKEIDTLKKEK